MEISTKCMNSEHNVSSDRKAMLHNLIQISFHKIDIMRNLPEKPLLKSLFVFHILQRARTEYINQN